MGKYSYSFRRFLNQNEIDCGGTIAMDSKVEINRQIEEIISQMKCKKDFQCYKSGFKEICEIKDIGMPDSIICLSKLPESCEYSFAFGDSCFCKCPLRLYIAKNLKK